MSRKVVGVAVIVFWALGLALLYQRNRTHSPQRSLAEAGMRVSPETYYYTLQRSGVQVGAASSSVDTTKERIVAVDFVRGAIPVGKDTIKLEARSEARFTRGMRLRDFVIKAIGDLKPFTLRGVMQEGEDKTLRITSIDGKGKPVTQESVPELPVFVPTIAPLPLMLEGEPKIGDSIAVAIFNPISRTVNPVTLHIEADSLFLVPDSAAFDSTSGRWVKAHQSSIRGWRIGSKPAALTAWVDMSGRVLAAAEPGGITLSRTTFELSFANWKLDHPTLMGVASTQSGNRKRN
ncbi:MAG TPA: hypothetical protein VFC35_01485 [Gemmatimonadaceae bacterium]|nr:hypothetical protein [Gemmatimonadaceae bacterium]